jgi:hypothetical protein
MIRRAVVVLVAAVASCALFAAPAGASKAHSGSPAVLRASDFLAGPNTEPRDPPGGPHCGPENDGLIVNLGGTYLQCTHRADGLWVWVVIPKPPSCPVAPRGEEATRGGGGENTYIVCG